MKLIDANVLIYARGAPHPYQNPCRRVLAEVQGRRLEANVDTEVLQEVIYVYWYRQRLERGLEYLDRLLVLFPTPFAVTRATIAAARELLARYPRLDPRDAIHAAVALEQGLEGIVSTDRGLDGIAGLTRFDPRDLT